MYKRKDGLYETSKTINGKRVFFRGRTIGEVNRKMIEYNADKKKGRKVPVIIDEWLEDKLNEIRNATSVAYQRYCIDLKEHFPNNVASYTPLDIKRYLTTLEKRGFGRQTIQGYYNCLRQVFAYAVLCGDVDVSPCAEVKVNKNLPQKKRDALTEEQERLVTKFRGEDWLLGVMLLYTGCRRGELMALRWQDIDFENNTITINKKVDYSFFPAKLDNQTKNKNGMRTIPLFYPLKKALEEYGNKRLGLIFTDNLGGIVPYSELHNRWQKYITRVGLGSVVIHQFRHSFSTLCFESGIDSKSASAFLGDTEQVMNNVYTQLRNNQKQTATDRLNEFLATRFEQVENA